uniref:Uncharacterized protein n=1 Tax=Panagrolaimus davidi TaxID=227884 RepID=A0A914PPZ3_9BILA
MISVEIIENVRTIQLLTREEYFLSKFTASVEIVRSEDVKAAKLDAIVLAIAFASVYFCDFISNGVGIPLIYNGYVKSNGVYIAAMNVTMTSYAIQFASWSLIDILHAKPAAESLIPLIDESIDDDGFAADETKKGIEKRIDGKIEVRNVSFAYPARPDLKVANGLNLRADIAKTIALVGPSGGGKSTIIQLLERFYEPQGGNIKIDNTDISMINLQNLRKQMALVGQEPILFSGSIIQNISLGIENLPLEEVKEACKMANATSFIERLPMGHETEVGEKGSLLSGGQKQRIAIARAIARKPKILLLDEATSALDSESERAVQEALEAATSGRTTITIAHRLSSIQNAHKIFFIEAGKVVEAGTHQELIEADGKYADLVKKQELNS